MTGCPDQAGLPALQPALAAEAVGGQVVQRAAQVRLGVAAERAPVPQQPLQRGLQQVLAGLAAASEQDRRAHQPVAAVGQEALKLPDRPVIRHRPFPSSPTKHEQAGRRVPWPADRIWRATRPLVAAGRAAARWRRR